jgi:hypothetical protein
VKSVARIPSDIIHHQSKRTSYIPAGSYYYYDYFIVGNSDRSKVLSGNARWSVGPFYTGYKHSYIVGGTLSAELQVDDVV